MKQKVLLVITFLLVFAIGFLILNQENQSSFTYSNFGESIPKFKIIGIDVSHHQGKINWKEVSDMKIDSDTISFVYLKATEGTSFIDPRYLKNSKSLNNYNLPFGSYHYYKPNENCKYQADLFIQTIGKSPLKPVLDIEELGELTKLQLIDSVKLFLKIVKQELSIEPIIYTYESFYLDNFKSSQLSSKLYWMASYKPVCEICFTDSIITWQFSDKGTINGIKEKVDLNVTGIEFWPLLIWKD